MALGDARTVPVGTYAKEYLTKAGIWSVVEKKVVPCEGVRAVLAAVESGNVDAGIIYKTDAAISKKVKVALEVAAADGPAISYPLALLELPTLLVTHDRQEVLALGYDLVVMDGGRVVQQGPAPQVFSRPVNHAVASILAIETIQPGHLMDLKGMSFVP